MMLATSKHVFKIKTCRNLFKNYDLLSADSTFLLRGINLLLENVNTTSPGFAKHMQVIGLLPLPL